jgi:hypothetical protein
MQTASIEEKDKVERTRLFWYNYLGVLSKNLSGFSELLPVGKKGRKSVCH